MSDDTPEAKTIKRAHQVLDRAGVLEGTLVARIGVLWGDAKEAQAELEALRKENETLDRRAEYERKEINKMRRVMQAAGTWDDFCAAYAKYERERGGVLS